MMKNVKRGKKLKNPTDMMRLLQGVINKVVMHQETDSKVGTLPALSNAWLAAFKSKVEYEEVINLRARLETLEREQREGDRDANR